MTMERVCEMEPRVHLERVEHPVALETRYLISKPARNLLSYQGSLIFKPEEHWFCCSPEPI